MKLKATLLSNDFIIAQAEALVAYIISMVSGLCKVTPTFTLDKENILMLMDIGNLLCRINECSPEQILDVFKIDGYDSELYLAHKNTLQVGLCLLTAIWEKEGKELDWYRWDGDVENANITWHMEDWLMFQLDDLIS